MRVDSLYNNYQPVLLSSGLNIEVDRFVLSVDVGVQTSYLIAALMNKEFNPGSMSLPTADLMKRGYFSVGSKFSQIFSTLGRGIL
jgi:hypothetical protein